jgi:hypothetical protein
MIWRAVVAIRSGRRVAHARSMTQLPICARLAAGAFTLVPGRRMNAVLFGGDSLPGVMVAAILSDVLAVILWPAQPAVTREESAATSNAMRRTPESLFTTSGRFGMTRLPHPETGSAVVAELVDAQR